MTIERLGRLCQAPRRGRRRCRVKADSRCRPAGWLPWTGSAIPVDLDGDGDLDLVANDGVSDDVVIFANDGAGLFSLITRLATPSGPTGMAVADFNGDGRPDVATGNVNAESVSIFLNRGCL